MRSLLGLTLLAAALPAQQDPSSPRVERLSILHINDFHGQIQPRELSLRPGRRQLLGGFAALEDCVTSARAAAGPEQEVWLTDGGDWYQGTPEGNEDRGRSILRCFNRLGFTAVAFGNHEFDYGEDNLIELARLARFPLLGANIWQKGAEKIRLRPYAKPYIIKKVGGLRIAIVGLVTSDTPNVSGGPFGAAAFVREERVLRALWPELQRKADQVVLLTHCGVSTDRALARAFPEIPLILGGHSHTALHRGHQEGRTWIAQSAGQGLSLSRVECRIDRAARRLRVTGIRLQSLLARAPAPATRRFLTDTFAHVGPKWDQPLGEVRGARDRDRRGSARSTPGGNFVAALLRREAKAQIGVTNKGGIRVPFAPGPITRRQIFQILPFDNLVHVCEMSGAQFRQVLAEGLRPGRQPLEIDGASYGFRVEAGRRKLAWVRVGGRDLQAEQRLRVATNSFLAAGGDGFASLAVLKSKPASPRFLRAILLAHVQQTGRIELVDDPRIRFVE